MRIIQIAKYNAHTQPIFASINILPLPELIYQQKLHLIHAFIHNYLPNSFENLILLNNQVHVHNYIFRNDRDFFVHSVFKAFSFLLLLIGLEQYTQQSQRYFFKKTFSH